jgi:hypothetical protein
LQGILRRDEPDAEFLFEGCCKRRGFEVVSRQSVGEGKREMDFVDGKRQAVASIVGRESHHGSDLFVHQMTETVIADYPVAPRYPKHACVGIAANVECRLSTVLLGLEAIGSGKIHLAAAECPSHNLVYAIK